MDVTDFLSQMESEMEIHESQQAAAAKTIESMKKEIQALTKRVEILTDEKYQLEASNAQLRQNAFDYQAPDNDTDISQLQEENQKLRDKLAVMEESSSDSQSLTEENQALKQQLKELTEKYDATSSLRQECESLREEIRSTEDQRKAIQEALISAQRMSDIVISEAKAEAKRLLDDAEQSASKMIADAEQRNSTLRASHDRMLADNAKLNAQLTALYRRHLSMLSDLSTGSDDPASENSSVTE